MGAVCEAAWTWQYSRPLGQEQQLPAPGHLQALPLCGPPPGSAGRPGAAPLPLPEFRGQGLPAGSLRAHSGTLQAGRPEPQYSPAAPWGGGGATHKGGSPASRAGDFSPLPEGTWLLRLVSFSWLSSGAGHCAQASRRRNCSPYTCVFAFARGRGVSGPLAATRPCSGLWVRVRSPVLRPQEKTRRVSSSHR